MKFPFGVHILNIIPNHIQMNSIGWFLTTFKGLDAWLAVVSVSLCNRNRLFTGYLCKENLERETRA